MSAPLLLRSAMGHVRTPLYLNAYALITSNAITSALGLVYWTLAARLYPTDVLGVSAAVISMLLFLSGVAQLNLRVALLRLVPAAGRATGRLVGRAYLIVLAGSAGISLVVFGGAAALGSPWSTLTGLSTPAGVGFLVVGTMAWSVFNIQDGVLAGLRRTLWVPVENGAYALAKILVLVALVGALPTLGIVASWILPVFVLVGLVSAALAWRWLPAHMAAGRDRDLQLGGRRLLGFVAADSVGAMFSLAASTLLPVIVVATAGPTTGAWFSIAWTIVMALALVPLNMAASLTIETVHSGANLAAGTRRLAVHVARLFLPVVLLVVLLAPAILRIFGPDYATNATDLLRLAALGLLPFAVTVIGLAVARVQAQGRTILAVQACAAVLTIGGSLLLLRPLGIAGVGLAFLVAQSVVAVGVLVGLLLPLWRTPPPIEAPAGVESETGA